MLGSEAGTAEIMECMKTGGHFTQILLQKSKELT